MDGHGPVLEVQVLDARRGGRARGNEQESQQDQAEPGQHGE
jgi:hypothetical protein